MIIYPITVRLQITFIVMQHFLYGMASPPFLVKEERHFLHGAPVNPKVAHMAFAFFVAIQNLDRGLVDLEVSLGPDLFFQVVIKDFQQIRHLLDPPIYRGGCNWYFFTLEPGKYAIKW